VDRLACVDLPSFPLQILLRRHPEWSGAPAAVVARESPQAEVLSVCDRARASGVVPGLTYAAALSLVPDLRAGTVLAADVDGEHAVVAEGLRNFSPHVEPAAAEPGTYWLDATGLERLHRTPAKWAGAIRRALKRLGLGATVVVGFTRFGTYALARGSRGTTVLRGAGEEEAQAGQVPLSRLGIGPSRLLALHRLGLRTAVDLAGLPAEGLLERFGPDVHRLRLLAAGEVWNPLQPAPAEETATERLYLDDPEENSERLTFLVKRLLDVLLGRVAHRHEAIVGVEIALTLDRHGRRVERLRPAAPTLDGVQLADLARLRLESINLPAGATELEITAETVPATAEQLRLCLDEGPSRDMEAANRALARLRAELGPGAVVRALVTEGHLPEACFRLEPLDSLPSSSLPHPPAPSPPSGEGELGRERRSEGVRRTLVRRVYARPIPLQARPVVGPRGAHLEGMGEAPSTRLFGPHVVSGGWWVREVHRDYYFTETEAGKVLWVYYDRRRRSWFLHGEVE